MTDHHPTPLAAGGDVGPRPTPSGRPRSADEVLTDLVGATQEAVDLLRQVVRGGSALGETSEQALDLARLETLGSAEAARVDAAKFLLGHAAPLLAELQGLRANATHLPDQPL